MKKPTDIVVVALAVLAALYLYWQNLPPTELSDTQEPAPSPAPITDIPPDADVPTFQDDPSSAAVVAARLALAAHLKIDTTSITIVDVATATFIDGCLGLAPAGEVCTQALTDGYLVILRARGELYTYRTDLTGSVVRFAQ